jgi:hypothetical protein
MGRSSGESALGEGVLDDHFSAKSAQPEAGGLTIRGGQSDRPSQLILGKSR